MQESIRVSSTHTRLVEQSFIILSGDVFKKPTSKKARSTRKSDIVSFVSSYWLADSSQQRRHLNQKTKEDDSRVQVTARKGTKKKAIQRPYDPSVKCVRSEGNTILPDGDRLQGVVIPGRVLRGEGSKRCGVI